VRQLLFKIDFNKGNDMRLNIYECVQIDLFQKYEGQSEIWPCWIFLDCQKKVLYAKAKPEGWIEKEEINGQLQKFSIPCLTGEAVNELLEEIGTLAKKVLYGYSFDNNEEKAVFTPKAQTVLNKINKILKNVKKSGKGFLCSRKADEWLFERIKYFDVDGYACSSDEDFATVEIDGIGEISAETSDLEIGQMEGKIAEDFWNQGIDVLEGLFELLPKLREGCIKTKNYLECLEQWSFTLVRHNLWQR